MNKKVTIAVSAGDPDGIGYDLCALLFKIKLKYKIHIYVNKKILFERAKIHGINNLKNKEITLIDIQKKNKRDLVLQCIKSAANACFLDKANALVTLPVNKAKLSTNKSIFTGHTEYIAKILKEKKEPLMTFIGNKNYLIATHTTHLSLLDAIKKVKKKILIKNIKNLNFSLVNQLGITKPKILVTGLNPHASENNLFGSEESNHIIPAIQELKNLKLNIDGPVPADTAILKNNIKKYDCIYYMYHDQALCAFKALFFDTGVNLTLGLPILRTSVDHGTAEDLVGKTDKISIKSFLNALNIAQKFAQ